MPGRIPGILKFTGWREPISISGAGKVVDGILRRRPCFFVPLIAFSSEVDAGSREENASNQESRASVLIQSEPKL
jgi:hypothetical protein